jgi:hypothetical protein
VGTVGLSACFCLQSPHDSELKGVPRTGKWKSTGCSAVCCVKHTFSTILSHHCPTSFAEGREGIGTLILGVTKMGLTGMGSDLLKNTQLKMVKDLSPDLL